jgi:hypothetical protein
VQVEVLEQELSRKVEEVGGSSQELDMLRRRLTEMDQERRLLEDRLDNAKVNTQYYTDISVLNFPSLYADPDPAFKIMWNRIEVKR